VQAALVSFVVARSRVVAYQLEQIPFRGHGFAETTQAEAVGFLLGVCQDAVCEVLAAVDIGSLRHHLLVPVVAGIGECLVVDLLVVVGAAEVQIHGVVTRHHGQVQRLGIDRETVAAELDDLGALLVDILPVLLRSGCVLAGRFEA